MDTLNNSVNISFSLSENDDDEKQLENISIEADCKICSSNIFDSAANQHHVSLQIT
jgi:hypothetical protein